MHFGHQNIKPLNVKFLKSQSLTFKGKSRTLIGSVENMRLLMNRTSQLLKLYSSVKHHKSKLNIYHLILEHF
jgi:hypothetical protein